VTVKANLRVVLYANDIVVAESEDPELWQSNLARITGRGATLGPSAEAKGIRPPEVERPNDFSPEVQHPNGGATGTLERFAADLDLDAATIHDACAPCLEPPFMHLDVRAWQEFKRNTAPRGSSSVPPIVLASTLLVLWFKAARRGTVTVSQAQAVLGTIDARDKNPARGLKNCPWLQIREDAIKLNAAKFDAALAVARAFCSHQPIEAARMVPPVPSR
jgi:hypothetical protein